MSQDIVADALNQIMNAKKVEKSTVEITRWSKLLLNLFERMKKEGYLDFEINEDEKKLIVTIKRINFCKAVKPRYFATVDEIDKYLRRFLPSRNFGSLIVSTNKGLLNQYEAAEKNQGGAIIAYYY